MNTDLLIEALGIPKQASGEVIADGQAVTIEFFGKESRVTLRNPIPLSEGRCIQRKRFEDQLPPEQVDNKF
jgi:hypothetical protein